MGAKVAKNSAPIQTSRDAITKNAEEAGPDMSHLDAGVNQYLKREMRKARAVTAAQQRVALQAAWDSLTEQ